MYIKIEGQKKNDLGECGTSAYFVRYLSKEDKPDEYNYFFNLDRDDVKGSEVISAIDRQNIDGLRKTDAKYYSMYINPSVTELEFIYNDKTKLKEYTRNIMRQYAHQFGRENINENSIVWFGKMEDNRYFTKKSEYVKHNRKFILNKNILENSNDYNACRLAQEQLNEMGAMYYIRDNKIIKTSTPNSTDIIIKDGMINNTTELSTHIHVIIRRKDISNTMSLSPMAHASNPIVQSFVDKDGNLKRTMTVGFNRNEYFANCEQIFDLQFGYNRQINEAFLFKKVKVKEIDFLGYKANLEEVNKREQQNRIEINKSLYNVFLQAKNGFIANKTEINKKILDEAKSNLVLSYKMLRIKAEQKLDFRQKDLDKLKYAIKNQKETLNATKERVKDLENRLYFVDKDFNVKIGKQKGEEVKVINKNILKKQLSYPYIINPDKQGQLYLYYNKGVYERRYLHHEINNEKYYKKRANKLYIMGKENKLIQLYKYDKENKKYVPNWDMQFDSLEQQKQFFLAYNELKQEEKKQALNYHRAYTQEYRQYFFTYMDEEVKNNEPLLKQYQHEKNIIKNNYDKLQQLYDRYQPIQDDIKNLKCQIKLNDKEDKYNLSLFNQSVAKEVFNFLSKNVGININPNIAHPIFSKAIKVLLPMRGVNQILVLYRLMADKEPMQKKLHYFLNNTRAGIINMPASLGTPMISKLATKSIINGNVNMISLISGVAKLNNVPKMQNQIKKDLNSFSLPK